MKRYVFAVALLAAFSGGAVSVEGQAKQVKPVRFTVILRGAVDEECCAALRASLKRVAGLEFDPNDIQAGTKDRFGHYFTPFVRMEVADPEKVDLGKVAQVVAETKTPRREVQPPSLNLILFHPSGMLVRSEIVALREAFGEVPGFDARTPGGTGAFPDQAVFRLRLDGSGVARFESLRQTLRMADLDLRLVKE